MVSQNNRKIINIVRSDEYYQHLYDLHQLRGSMRKSGIFRPKRLTPYHWRQKRVEYEFQGELFKASVKSNLTNNGLKDSVANNQFQPDVYGVVGSPPAGSRGAIDRYSSRSRGRLMEKTARLDNDSYKLAVFITLTYGQCFPSPELASNHRRAFLERLRRAYPKMSAIWKLEYQDRGAPHFHFICFNLPYLPKNTLASMWLEIVGFRFANFTVPKPKKGEVYEPEFLPAGFQPPFTRIEAIRTRRGVTWYIAKYIAKECEAPNTEGVNVTEGDSGFNSLPYLHAGRFWGVHNKKYLPLADKYRIIVFGLKKSFYDVKRLVSRKIKRKTTSNQGFKVFSSNIDKWEDYLLSFLLAEDDCIWSHDFKPNLHSGVQVEFGSDLLNKFKQVDF